MCDWHRDSPVERPGMVRVDIEESARFDPALVIIDTEFEGAPEVDARFSKVDFEKTKHSYQPGLYHFGSVGGKRAYVAKRVQDVAAGLFVVTRDLPRLTPHPKKGPYRT